MDQASFFGTTISSTNLLHILVTPSYKGFNNSVSRPLLSSHIISKIISSMIFTFCLCIIALISISSTLLNPLRKSYTRSFQMGPQCNLHNPFSPTIMAHLNHPQFKPLLHFPKWLHFWGWKVDIYLPLPFGLTILFMCGC